MIRPQHGIIAPCKLIGSTREEASRHGTDQNELLLPGSRLPVRQLLRVPHRVQAALGRNRRPGHHSVRLTRGHVPLCFGYNHAALPISGETGVGSISPELEKYLRKRIMATQSTGEKHRGFTVADYKAEPKGVCTVLVSASSMIRRRRSPDGSTFRL